MCPHRIAPGQVSMEWGWGAASMPPDSSELAMNTRLMMVASQSQRLRYSPAGRFIVNCCSEPYLSKNLKACRMPQLDEERRRRLVRVERCSSQSHLRVIHPARARAQRRAGSWTWVPSPPVWETCCSMPSMSTR